MVVVAPEEDPKLAKLVDHVVREMEPLEVWLFGSRAEGRARPDSDYDILVIVPDAALDAWLDPRRTWQVGHDAGVIADIIPCVDVGGACMSEHQRSTKRVQQAPPPPDPFERQRAPASNAALASEVDLLGAPVETPLLKACGFDEVE